MLNNNDKYTLDDLLREEQQRLNNTHASNCNNNITNNYDYQPLYDNNGYCSRFN